MSATSFLMANTEENINLLNEASNAWFPGDERMSSVEVMFDDAEECARVKEEVSVRSSCFDPNEL